MLSIELGTVNNVGAGNGRSGVRRNSKREGVPREQQGDAAGQIEQWSAARQWIVVRVSERNKQQQVGRRRVKVALVSANASCHRHLQTNSGRGATVSTGCAQRSRSSAAVLSLTILRVYRDESGAGGSASNDTAWLRAVAGAATRLTHVAAHTSKYDTHRG